MAIFSFSFPIFGFLSSTTKQSDHRFRTQIVPALNVLKRKAITPAVSRTTHTKANNGSGTTGSAEPATEASTLGAFPRPNLYTTLHTRIGIYSTGVDNKTKGNDQKCTHCAGPHRTEYCPC